MWDASDPIGSLRDRLEFACPAPDETPSGGTWDGYVPQFEAAANIRYLRGGETVQAARLQGRQPVVVRVHNSAAARRVTSDWMFRDTRRETRYNITSGPVPSDDQAWLEFTATAGVAL